MHERDAELLETVREHLNIGKKLYHFQPWRKDGHNRGGTARLMIRDFGTLKNVIIPLFYDKLVGNKAIQLEEWLEKIGNDPAVPESYRLLYRLHKSGYYRDNPKFLD